MTCIEIKIRTHVSSIWARTKSHLRWSDAVQLSEVTWPEVTWPEVMSVTWPEVTPATYLVLKHAQPEVALYRHSGAFLTRSDVSHVTGRGPVWKWPWPEVCSAHARFSPRFFLSSSTVVTWLPGVTEGHLIPSVFPWVCACATGSCATPIVTPLEVFLGRPITIGNPASYI
jgi:hypothetical protein